MRYAFAYPTSQRHEFGENFGAPILTLGGPFNFNFIRPFGGSDVYQVGDLSPSPQPFLIQGVLEGSTMYDDLSTLSTRLATATTLYRTDDDQTSDEVYVEVDNAAQPLEKILRVHTSDKSNMMTLQIYFWPKKSKWRLSSDDSEVLI